MIERRNKNNPKAEIGYPVLPAIRTSINEFDVYGNWIVPSGAVPVITPARRAAAIWGTSSRCGVTPSHGILAPSASGAPVWNCKAFLSPLSVRRSRVRHEEF
jgi:hypothetical protein